MAGQLAISSNRRIVVWSLVVGVGLVAAGVSSIYTLWSASFSRYMHLEDLAMAGTLPVDDTTLGLIGRFSPGERQLAVTALVLVILGSASLLVAAISHLRQRRKP